MRFRKFGIPFLPNGISVTPAAFNQLYFEGDLTLTSTVAAVAVYVAEPSPIVALINLKNISTSGQRIRVGFLPSFSGTVAGILLMPGDSYELINFNANLNAIPDITGAVLNQSIYITP